MTESVNVTTDDLAALRAEIDRLKLIVQRGPQTIVGPDHPVDALAARDFATMVNAPGFEYVPRSHPLGYLEGAPWEARQRMKLEAVARQKGGRRDADSSIPSIYAGDWTPDVEHRWEYALGLRDDIPGKPLDKPEQPGSQLSNERRVGDREKRLGRTR